MSIPICPLMSTAESVAICAQEQCNWYIKNYKVCAVFMLGHEAALNVKQKQLQKQQKSEQ